MASSLMGVIGPTIVSTRHSYRVHALRNRCINAWCVHVYSIMHTHRTLLCGWVGMFVVLALTSCRESNTTTRRCGTQSVRIRVYYLRASSTYILLFTTHVRALRFRVLCDKCAGAHETHTNPPHQQQLKQIYYFATPSTAQRVKCE